MRSSPAESERDSLGLLTHRSGTSSEQTIFCGKESTNPHEALTKRRKCAGLREKCTAVSFLEIFELEVWCIN